MRFEDVQGIWKDIEGKCLINVLSVVGMEKLGGMNVSNFCVRLEVVKGRLWVEGDRIFQSVLPKRKWVMTVYNPVLLGEKGDDGICVSVKIQSVWEFEGGFQDQDAGVDGMQFMSRGEW